MAVDGFKWYLPARRVGKKLVVCGSTEPTGGTTVLEVSNPGDDPVFPEERRGRRARTSSGAGGTAFLRSCGGGSWQATARTLPKNARRSRATGRSWRGRARGFRLRARGSPLSGSVSPSSGSSLPGPGALRTRRLSLQGSLMVAEGFYWYLPGRRAGRESSEAVKRTEHKSGIWDVVFPPRFRHDGSEPLADSSPCQGVCLARDMGHDGPCPGAHAPCGDGETSWPG